MLRETRAKSASYDRTTDTLDVRAEDDCGSGTRSAQLLLDDRGFLVGVDLDDGAPDRLVVMLGPHEAVDRTARARVRVAGPTVTIENAKKRVRGDEPSPYV